MFHFPLLFSSYPHGLKGFIERSNVDHSKSSVAIVLGDNVSLDFITFTVPKEVKKEVNYLFYNLRELEEATKDELLGRQPNS